MAQSYSDFELLIIDDGSSDNTFDVVKKYTDSRVKYWKKENGERGAARNFGTRKASGEYVNFLDSDDLLYDNHLQTAVDLILNCKNHPACFHLNYDIKSAKGKLKEVGEDQYEPLNQKLLEGNFLSINGVFIKKEVAVSLPFSEDRRLVTGEDWLLWLQIAARHPVLFSNIVTSTFVHHDERSVSSLTQSKLDNSINIIETNLLSDTKFLDKFGFKGVKRVKAHMLTYASLNLALSEKRLLAIKYFLSMILIYPREIFKRRTLAIVKHIFT